MKTVTELILCEIITNCPASKSQPGKRGEKVLKGKKESEWISQAIYQLIFKTFFMMQRIKKSSSAFFPAKYQPIVTLLGKKFISHHVAI